MLISPPIAAAQDGTPTPSPKELWQTYPLDPTPQAGTPTPAPLERTPSAPPSTTTADDGGTLGPILGGAAALIALGAAALLLRRRHGHGHGRERAPARIAWAAPLLPAAAAAAIPPAGRPGRPRLTRVAPSGSDERQKRRGRTPDRPRAARPPDAQREWTAEVQWHDDGDGPRFCVVARTAGAGPAVTVLSSEQLEWPPADAAGVQRLSNATQRLETDLLTAGWTPLPPGEAWYAKRFAWGAPVASAPAERATPPRPDAERASEPPQDAERAPEPPQDAAPAPEPPEEAERTPEPPQDAAPAPELPQERQAGRTPEPPQGYEAERTPEPPQDAAPAPKLLRDAARAPEPSQDAERASEPLEGAAPPAGRRFKRQTEWPEGTEELWRCEIRWHAGYVNSRFEAVAHEPKGRHKVTVVRSDVFKWLLMADPPPGGPEYSAEVRRLADRLEAAGWQPAQRGRHWYELRFVWDSEGRPPTHLELEPVEQQGGADGAS